MHAGRGKRGTHAQLRKETFIVPITYLTPVWAGDKDVQLSFPRTKRQQ